MRTLQIVIIGLLLSRPAFASLEGRTVDGATDSLIGLLVDSDAVEHRKARQIHYVKDQGLVLVFFTIEGFNGGNNYTFYLAVFQPSWKFDPSKGEAQQRNAENIAKYKLVGYSPIGGKGKRFVDFTKFAVEKRQITLQTKEYASTDPTCCPSKAGTAIYRIEDNQLIEVKPNNSLQPTSALMRRRD